MLKKFRQ